jgi:vacuole morphology and inheritance protein 14
MELLDADANGDLIRTLSGLLMIMPQTNAFRLLRDRLACLPNLQR